MKRQKNKGITLIALVITIIVLLILAGVVIVTLSGNNSAPQKATEAAQKDAIAEAKDEIAMETQKDLLDYYDNKYVSKTSTGATGEANTRGVVETAAARAIGNVQSRNKTLLTTSGVDTTEHKITLRTKSFEVIGTIEENGGITWGEITSNGGQSGDTTTWTGSVTSAEQTALSNNGMAVIPDDQVPSNLKTSSVKAVLTGNVPVPTGYTYVEGTSTTESSAPNSWGVVIEDGSQNQFVWVPVNATESIAPSGMYETISATQVGVVKEPKEEKVAEEKAQIAYAGKLNGVKLASVEGINGINFGLKVADSESESASGSEETETEEERAEREAREAREADEQAAKATTVTKKSKSAIGISRGNPNDTSSYREPALVTAYDLQSTYYNQAGFNSATEMAQAFVKDYNDMIASISKYGGFYVGRYELSGSVENPTVIKGGRVLNYTNWYQSYKACKEFEGSSTTSTMLWGTQWDIMCLWTQKKGNQVSYNERHSNRHTGSVANTGANSNDKSNNIYDIEGNCREWTQEAVYTGSRATRGGDYDSNYASIRGGYYPNYENNSDSSRPSLYIK